MRTPLFEASVLAILAIGAMGVWTMAFNDRYAIEGYGSRVWRVDTRTGDLSVCVRGSVTEGPACLPWGSKRFEKRSPATVPQQQDHPLKTNDKEVVSDGFWEMLNDNE